MNRKFGVAVIAGLAVIGIAQAFPFLKKVWGLFRQYNLVTVERGKAV